MKYFIKTFGCQQNVADSERVEQAFKGRGMKKAHSYSDANYVIINTCMVRQTAEHRVYGLVNNLGKIKEKKTKNNELYKIIVTGCMVGIAFRDASGKYLNRIREIMPEVDEFMPIEEVGFDNEPVRQNHEQAWVPISNGCNNFCTFCIVPFTRGREISRPYEDIIDECIHLKAKRYKKVTLLGQNVNSYGSDLIMGKENIQVMRDLNKTYFEGQPVILSNAKDLNAINKKIDSSSSTQNDKNNNFPTTLRARLTYNGRPVEPVYVKHLGRHRIPTLFPYLLEDVARMDFEEVSFYSSNPWDFSDELIDVIAQYDNITRTIHLPIQSGDNAVLKRMNRWYTAEEYLTIINKLKAKVPGIKFTTDIIVGFCGETDEEFQNTVKLVKQVGYDKAFISMYSERPMTAATKVFKDDVDHKIKKDRWEILDELINGRFRKADRAVYVPQAV
ncbi:MAG TPA: radical SAM protein [Candidatus Woesebacteria bacterium]|nr:radical SAM protein [Candidatus Woesebacteria bacterium]